MLCFLIHNRMNVCRLVLAGADVCLVPLRNMPTIQRRAALQDVRDHGVRASNHTCDRWRSSQMVEQEAGAAVYVEPENAGALASAILHLYEHPEVAEALGERGRAFVEAHFDREKLVEELEIHISGLLGGNTSRFELAVERTPVVAGVEKSQV